MSAAHWWQTAVVYEVYVRSYRDASGDGVGDLAGIRAGLDHLQDLGVDALWLTPFYPSPMADHGYDVADPRDVEPLFGTLADFDDLLADVHARGMRLVVDVVPNHSSDRHPWFQQALAAAPGSFERSRYLFRDGVGVDGGEPPNNWQSTFGGPAWTRVPDGQWYLHLFAPQQPDWDWRNPEVGDDYERTLRFWLDRGVDGFRIDVAHGLFKAVGLPDNPGGAAPALMEDTLAPTGMWDQPEVHEVYRRWRTVCAEYPRDPMLVGEVWLGDARRQAAYVRPGELDLVFNFRLLFAPWDAAEMAAAVDHATTELRAVGAPASWVLSNHDVVRHVTRYGGGQVGLARARAALLLEVALPGPLFLYQGEELGLAEVTVPEADREDPVWERSGHTDPGRDGCRVPLPWSGSAPPYGFGGMPTWLPQPPDWAGTSVDAQGGEHSMLAFYRRTLALRDRDADPLASLVWHRRTGGVLDVSVGDRRCVLNLGAAPLDLPVGEVLLASGPLDGAGLPPDTAVLLRA